MTARARRAHGFVLLNLTFTKENDRWVSVCKELGTATFAPTVEEAKDELIELVGLHLNSLEAVGERQRFFREHRIKFYTDQDSLPREVTVRIPVAPAGELEKIGPVPVAVAV